MELTLITLSADGPATGHLLDGGRVGDLMWAASRPGELLEHVSTQAGPGWLHLGVFTLTSEQHTAGSAALAICRRALAASPLLRGWRIAAVRPGA
ncbi:hypothetical protein GCM10009665_34070 [Kitasatospora nipponensis]|uniref:Uncharacterized protein n=1 Tax=Kitasatospora nipponensis TaxID=258049 RepID=A0ABP4GZZ3_9ACTN